MISIIIPVYKVEAYLADCINSVLAQTCTDFELILVDDGSPDSCGELCDRYAARDSRISVIHQENGGLSAARNAGLDAAKGEYIMFVDSDDWIEPDTLEVMLPLLQNTGADLAVCSFQITKTFPADTTAVRHLFPGQTLSMEAVLADQCTPNAWIYTAPWAKLYSRDLFDGIRFPVGFIYEDSAVWHRILGKCRTIALTDRVLYNYRAHPNSITSSAFSVKHTDHLAAWVDRTLYCHKKGWHDWKQHTIRMYMAKFFEYYTHFERNEENLVYFKRMEHGLRKLLPFLLQHGDIPLRHKLYLILICIHPSLYAALRSLKG